MILHVDLMDLIALGIVLLYILAIVIVAFIANRK